MFSLTQEADGMYLVQREEKPFLRRRRWHDVQRFKTEKQARDCILKLAAFKPHTTYFDEYGKEYLEPVEW